jgi:peptidoglycan hydrolase-like protein with peptidoglycan-binding domain
VAVQQALSSRGFDAGPADGAVGPKVRQAIRSFQTDNNMVVTGEIDANLMSKLGVGTTTSAVARADTGAMGLSSDEVLELEQSLTALGYKTGKVDGIYDARTRAAIQDYQTDEGLADDGLATPTLAARVEDDLSQRTGISSTGSTGTTLSSAQTLQLQEALAEEGYYSGALSGVYDTQTRAAVRSYQQSAGLSATGNADAALLSRLAGTTQTSASAATIMKIEQKLKDRGYVVGTVDGVLDAQSQTAIRDFLRHAQINMSPAPSEQLLLAIQSSEMDAKKGAKQDLVSSGVNAITNMLGN